MASPVAAPGRSSGGPDSPGGSSGLGVAAAAAAGAAAVAGFAASRGTSDSEARHSEPDTPYGRPDHDTASHEADGIVGENGLIGADGPANSRPDEAAIPNRHAAAPETGQQEGRRAEQEGGRRRAQPDVEDEDARLTAEQEPGRRSTEGGRRAAEPEGALHSEDALRTPDDDRADLGGGHRIAESANASLDTELDNSHGEPEPRQATGSPAEFDNDHAGLEDDSQDAEFDPDGRNAGLEASSDLEASSENAETGRRNAAVEGERAEPETDPRGEDSERRGMDATRPNVDADRQPATEEGSHAGAAAAGVAAAGLAAAGLAATRSRDDAGETEGRHGLTEDTQEPPFEQDFDASYHDSQDSYDSHDYAGDEDHTQEHHDFVPSRNGTGPANAADDDEDHTAPYEPVDAGHEEPVLFTHGNEPAREDELFTHSDRDDYEDESDYDPGPPTAMIMPGSEVPGALPVPEMPVAPSGGRRKLRERPAEPARHPEPALADLQARLDELDVPEAAYRLGGPAERGWSVEEVDEGWRVGWYDGELINPAVFGDAEDAAAFMLGKVLMYPDGYVAAEPAPPAPADPVADAPKPPVMATLSPEVATGSFPVRPRENVPPQEQTAFTPADQLLADDEPPVRQPPPPPTQIAAPVSAPPTQVTPPVGAPPMAPPVGPPPTQIAPAVGAPPRREPPVRREEPVRANGSGGGSGQWPISPLAGEPPLTLFRGKELRELPAGSELDRFGGPNGNLTYAAGTPFEERSLVPEWVNRPYHVYRVQRPLETLAGVAIPWFNQPGGGSAYLLPASIDELLAEGDLIELDPGEPPID